MSKLGFPSLALGFVFVAGCFGEASIQEAATGKNGSGAPLSGAIFTTTIDGSRVNANIYADKADVYLDGGPGNGAPSKAAALPEGDYYFMVTDPSGKTLLSSDAIGCRQFHVDADGVIDAVVASGCAHATGVDQDHAKLGAITVQLMPYDDTPNNGGEYKVWVTPVLAYGGDDGQGHKHGFANSASKTDNFKVRTSTPIHVCGDGVVDEGEQCDDGNHVDGDGCSANCTKEETHVCGDGTLDAGEQCDDGNNVNGDGCSATCTTETPPPPPCCGNGTVESGEECDDGNKIDGDGCSSTCKIEPPPPPPGCCGDGVLGAGEQCDDGNTVNGDGCSSTCVTEPPKIRIVL